MTFRRGVPPLGFALVLMVLVACLPNSTATLPVASTEIPVATDVPTSTPGPVSRPSLEEILSAGQESMFLVCASSENWIRPSEEEQRREWWENSRHLTEDPKTLEHILYPWTHNFIMHYGGASPQYDLVNLSGIWAASDIRWQCEDSWRESRLGTSAEPGVEIWAEIWVLQHRVRAVKHLGTNYVVVVEPITSGFQIVDFQRPSAISLSITFVTPQGEIVDQIVEGVSPWTNEVTTSA